VLETVVNIFRINGGFQKYFGDGLFSTLSYCVSTGRPKSLATRDPQKLETKMSKNAFYFCLGTSGRLPASNFPHMQTFSKALF